MSSIIKDQKIRYD